MNNYSLSVKNSLNLYDHDILIVTPFFSPDLSAQAFQSTRFCNQIQQLTPKSLTILHILMTDAIIENSYNIFKEKNDYFKANNLTKVFSVSKHKFFSLLPITRQLYRFVRPYDPLICISGLQKKIKMLRLIGKDYSLIFLMCEPLASAILAPQIRKLYPNARIIGWFSDPLPFFYFEFSIRTNFRRRLLQYKLAKSLKCLDGVVTVSKYISNQVACISNNHSLRITEVCHMFDKDYWRNEGSFVNRVGSNKNAITLLHSGALYWKRNPIELIKALNKNSSIYGEKSIKIILEGSCASEIASHIKSIELTDGLHVNLLPPASLEQSYKSMQMADILLLIDVALDINVHQPSKIADYVASRKPILYVGKEQSEVTRILSLNHPAFSIYDPINIDETILSLLEKGRTISSEMYNEVVEIFSPEHVVQSLIKALDLAGPKSLTCIDK